MAFSELAFWSRRKMVKIDYFDIQFDSKAKVFYAGQQISGAVIAGIENPIKVLSIEIRVIGMYRVIAVVTLSAEDACLLTALTAHCGQELMCESSFYVLSIVDQRQAGAFYPENALCTEACFDVYGCFSCWSKGQIEASLTIAKTGYTIGETIHADIKVHNKSTGKKVPILLELVQEALFKSMSRYENVYDHKTHSRTIENAQTAPVDPGRTSDVSLALPLNTTLTPTSVGDNLIINVTYKIRLYLGEHYVICTPVFIATVNSTPSEAASKLADDSNVPTV
uniref:Arrestin C-terminal-like domain-containing protein n=1 Tax=Romanomermis culicivorax TaxID=13658 RepID=A0A915I557_ROMCU